MHLNCDVIQTYHLNRKSQEFEKHFHSVMSSEMLTVLFTPLDYHGHINACHGIGETLRDRGHKVVFAIDKAFEGKLSAYGFYEELLEAPLTAKEHSGDSEMDGTSAQVLKHKDAFKEGSLAMTEKFVINGFSLMTRFFMEKDTQYKEIIARVKPDLIVIDSYIGSPTLTNSGIPWVWLYSAAPLMAWNDENMSPAWSGMFQSHNCVIPIRLS